MDRWNSTVTSRKSSSEGAFKCRAERSTRLLGVSLAVLSLALSVRRPPRRRPRSPSKPAPFRSRDSRDTGNILGAGAALQVQYTINGTEYGGFPPPLIGVNFFTPAGTKLHPQGLRELLAERR